MKIYILHIHILLIIFVSLIRYICICIDGVSGSTCICLQNISIYNINV